MARELLARRASVLAAASPLIAAASHVDRRDGNLYVANSENISIGNRRSVDSHRIRRVGTDGLITTFAGVWAQGFSGDGGPATKAAFNYPQKVALDREGNLFIADNWNNRVRRVDSDGVITTVAGNGQEGSSGNGCPPTKASLTPRAIAIAGHGTLYIAEGTEGYGRICRVSDDG